MSRARDNANLSPTIADARMPNLTGDITTVEGAVATTIATDAVDIAMLSATGTADATTFLRGDNAWQTAGDTLSFTTKTGTSTLTTSEEGIIIANKATAFTINLPAVSGNSELFYHIKSIGAGAVTVDGNSSETIDGQITQVLTQWNNMYIITNGTTWYIL